MIDHRALEQHQSLSFFIADSRFDNCESWQISVTAYLEEDRSVFHRTRHVFKHRFQEDIVIRNGRWCERNSHKSEAVW